MRLAGTVASLAVQVLKTRVTGRDDEAVTPAPRAEPWWVQRHLDKIAEAGRGGIELLFLGDSITENYEMAGPDPEVDFHPIWRELFAPRGALNLGFSGDRTEHLLWRLQHGEVDGLRPRDVVVLIGTNDTAAGRVPGAVIRGIEAVVRTVAERMPGARVLLLEVLPSAISAQKSAADDAVNAVLREQFAGSERVQVLNPGGLFLRDGMLDAELFYDGRLSPPGSPLHPNATGQRRMAEAVCVALYGALPGR